MVIEGALTVRVTGVKDFVSAQLLIAVDIRLEFNVLFEKKQLFPIV